jgi:bacillithiol synthase
MDSFCIRHSELPHTSQLFLDYQYNFERVSRFYDHPPRGLDAFRAARARIDFSAERRVALVAALREQNPGAPALDVLARPDTVAVVTGQQVGLFTGPCYTIYKALTAAKLARTLTENGMPAVAVFWLATEDHDLEEIRRAWVFDPENQPVALDVPASEPAARPVGGIPVEHPPVQALRDALAGFPFGEDVVGMVERAYPPGAPFGAAFARLLGELLSSQELLFLDPMRPSFRELAAPMLAEAVRQAPALTERVMARSAELVAAGYHAQVLVDKQTSFVFLLDGGRRISLERRGDEYLAAGRRLSSAELAGRAAQLSPNALLRPVVQDSILPTVAYIGGPAEIAYLAQSRAIYETLLGRMPVAVPRESATLLDARSAKLMSRYGLALPDFFLGAEAVQERIAATLVPPSLAAVIAETKNGAVGGLERLADALAAFDPTLVDASLRSRRKIEWQLGKIGRKVAREAMRRDGRASSEAACLNGLICPDRRLQERVYTILPFLARHGFGLIERLADDVNLDCPDHRVITV